METIKAAIISDDKLYRYCLRRAWDENLPQVNFTMLNPSVADATVDDNTIRRCISYARAWGYGSIVVTNLFAYRATDPARLKVVVDPVGPDNDRWLAEGMRASKLVVCAWGELGSLHGRAAAVVARFPSRGVLPHYLRLNKSGSPAHPLRLPASLTPRPWLCQPAG